jgi:hypothetical protein
MRVTAFDSIAASRYLDLSQCEYSGPVIYYLLLWQNLAWRKSMADWLVATLREDLGRRDNPVDVYLTLHQNISSSDPVRLCWGARGNSRAWIGTGSHSFPAQRYGIRHATETPHSPSSRW